MMTENDKCQDKKTAPLHASEKGMVSEDNKRQSKPKREDLDQNFLFVFEPHWIATMATFGASILSASITYPAEQWRVKWEQQALREWNFRHQVNDAQQRSHRVVTPFVRLWTNQTASGLLQYWWHPDSTLESLETQLLAGALAGTAQVALLLPLDLVQIYRQHSYDLESAQSWRHWWKSHWSDGGSWDPIESHHRSLRSVGWMIAREIAFNCSFFPIFEFLKNHAAWGNTYWNPPWASTTKSNEDRLTVETVVSSGVGAGVLSAWIVTPMDTLQVYFRHSRQVWHWWNGLSIQAPPMPLLGRGLLLQACFFGPSFGLVAAIYDLTEVVG